MAKKKDLGKEFIARQSLFAQTLRAYNSACAAAVAAADVKDSRYDEMACARRDLEVFISENCSGIFGIPALKPASGGITNAEKY